MQLVCKNCGEPVPASDVNIQTMTAACKACDAVFRFDAHELEPAKAKRMNAAPPIGFTIEEKDDGFAIDMNWRKMFGDVEWMLSFLTTLGGLVLGIGGLALIGKGLQNGEIVAAVIGLGMTTIAGVLVYVLLMLVLLFSRLDLDREWVTFKHRPLYWPGKRIRREDIASVSLKPLNQFASYRTLTITTHDGKGHQLDHFQIAQARYIQQRLNQALFAPPEIEHSPAELTIDNIDQMKLSDDGEWVIDNAQATSAKAGMSQHSL